MLSLISRAFQLYVGGLQQIPERNLYVWSSCCRGLLETIGAVEYARANPRRIVHLFSDRGVSAGKLRSALGDRYTVTRRDIDQLSRLVHPADLSVWATIRSEGRKRTIYFGGADFSRDDVLKAAALLFQCLSDFNAATRSLIEENGSILEEGSVFMTAGSESGRR